MLLLLLVVVVYYYKPLNCLHIVCFAVKTMGDEEKKSGNIFHCRNFDINIFSKYFQNIRLQNLDFILIFFSNDFVDAVFIKNTFSKTINVYFKKNNFSNSCQCEFLKKFQKFFKVKVLNDVF